MNILSKLKTFESLKNTTFRLYFVSMAGQWAAQSMQLVVQSYLIYQITDSAVILGIMALAIAIPQVALSLFAGVLADRFPKKVIIQFSQAVMAFSAFSIGLLLTIGYLSSQNVGSWWILLVMAAFQGITNALIMPARQAIVPELVGKEYLLNAMSLMNSGMNIFQFIAPAIGGFLIDAFNFQAVYFVMGGLYLLAIVITGFLPNTGRQSHTNRNIFIEVVQGLKYIGGNRNILFVTVFTLICIIVGTPIAMMSSIFAEDVLEVGATGLGILQSVSGVGAFSASLVLASLPDKKRGLIMLMGGFCMGLSLLVFSFSRYWPLSIAMIFFSGVGKITHITPGVTLWQTYSDKEFLGRVQSIQMLSIGIGSLATFTIGMLTNSIGIQWAMGSFSIALVVISLLATLFVSALRKLD